MKTLAAAALTLALITPAMADKASCAAAKSAAYDASVDALQARLASVQAINTLPPSARPFYMAIHNAYADSIQTADELYESGDENEGSADPCDDDDPYYDTAEEEFDGAKAFYLQATNGFYFQIVWPIIDP